MLLHAYEFITSVIEKYFATNLTKWIIMYPVYVKEYMSSTMSLKGLSVNIGLYNLAYLYPTYRQGYSQSISPSLVQ